MNKKKGLTESLLGNGKLPLVPWLARGWKELQRGLIVRFDELVLEPHSDLEEIVFNEIEKEKNFTLTQRSIATQVYYCSCSSGSFDILCRNLDAKIENLIQ